MTKVKNWMSRRLTTIEARNAASQFGNHGPNPLERPETYATMLRVVATLTPDRSLREDLVQEAVIHLWQLYNRRPGQRVRVGISRVASITCSTSSARAAASIR